MIELVNSINRVQWKKKRKLGDCALKTWHNNPIQLFTIVSTWGLAQKQPQIANLRPSQRPPIPRGPSNVCARPKESWPSSPGNAPPLPRPSNKRASLACWAPFGGAAEARRQRGFVRVRIRICIQIDLYTYVLALVTPKGQDC